jgi:nucleoside-diphosphate-sugar epimerase
MVTDYIVPIEKTHALLGPPRASLEQGVAETTAWLKSRKV